jgi:proteasome lid subunit RPN8/RPN11
VRRIPPCAKCRPILPPFRDRPAGLIAALRAEREAAQVVIGYYHSHPSGDPAPSATDMAPWPRMTAASGQLLPETR